MKLGAGLEAMFQEERSSRPAGNGHHSRHCDLGLVQTSAHSFTAANATPGPPESIQELPAE